MIHSGINVMSFFAGPSSPVLAGIIEEGGSDPAPELLVVPPPPPRKVFPDRASLGPPPEKPDRPPFVNLSEFTAPAPAPAPVVEENGALTTVTLTVNSVNPAWNSLPNVVLLLCYRDPCSYWLLRDWHHGHPRVWRRDFRHSFSRSAGVLLGKRGAHGSRYSRWTGPVGLLQQWDSYARSGSPRSTRYSTTRSLLVYVSGVSTTGRVRQVNKSPLFAVKYSFISEQLVLWSSSRLQAAVDNGVYESTENVYEDIPTSATKKKGKTDGKKRKGPPKSQSTHGRWEIRFVNSRYNHISRNTSKHL